MLKKNKQALAREDIRPLLSKKIVIRGLLVFICGSVAGWVGYVSHNKELFPITTIRAQGSFAYVTEDMLNKAIENINGKGFFTIDVAKIKNRVELLPWVKQASVKRVWPGTLNIAVSERKPVAMLKAGGLVDSAGEIFYPVKQTDLKTLVVFDVSSKQVKACLNYYYDSVVMLNKLGLQVTKVSYSNRQSLSYRLDDKFELVIGRQNKLYRLNRFAKIYQNNLNANKNNISNIDMRYTNGLSVEWKEGQKPARVNKNNIAQNNREPGHV